MSEADLQDELAALQNLSANQLRAEWQRVLGKPAPGISTYLMERGLVVLAERLDELVRADGTQVRKLDILKGLFGENAAKDGYRRAVERAGAQSRSGGFSTAKTGAVSFAGAEPAGSVAAPAHRFYGGPAR
jgi:hypothetical protein